MNNFRIKCTSLRLTTALLLASLPGFLGCSSTALPSDLEIQSSIATTTWLQHHYGISNNYDLNKLVARVSKRLGEGVYNAALEVQLDRDIAKQFDNFPWQVFVLSTEEPNAFCAGAGSVFVTEGLVRILETEAQLAAVISHEMGHQLLGHPGHAIVETGLSEDRPVLAYSLNQELDADTLGLRILQRARYDVRHAAFALNTSYRPVIGSVAKNPKWLMLRLSNYHQQISGMPSIYPATQNTREFTKVMQGLAKAPLSLKESGRSPS